MHNLTVSRYAGVLQLAAAGLLMGVAGCSANDKSDGSDYEFLSAASEPYVPSRILDTDAMPIEGPQGNIGWGVKTLFENPNGGHLRILYVPPGRKGAKVHYHEFHEWAWNIWGDFTNNESTMPDQVLGPLQRFVAGDFLSRPPYSLHGGEKDRQDFMQSQIGAVILIMEESDVGQGTWCVDPDCRAGDSRMSFNPDYKEIMHWSTPRIIDTIDDMPWQPVKSSPGLNVKHLVADPSHGFRARMWFLEAGADTPESLTPHYYKQAHQFNWVIAGDLKLQTLGTPDSEEKSASLGQHYLWERPPMSISGLPEQGATQGGAVWLEVTYAKGTTWTDETTPIEEPIYVE